MYHKFTNNKELVKTYKSGIPIYASSLGGTVKTIWALGMYDGVGPNLDIGHWDWYVHDRHLCKLYRMFHECKSME
jgi:hypothetical protein